jgi:hypothetical protein
MEGRLSAIAATPRIVAAGGGSYMIRCSDCAKGFADEKLKPGRRFKVDEQLATSRLLFLAELLECGIAAQRIPERIEP